MKKVKKIISVLVCLCLLLSLFSFTESETSQALECIDTLEQFLFSDGFSTRSTSLVTWYAYRSSSSSFTKEDVKKEVEKYFENADTDHIDEDENGFCTLAWDLPPLLEYTADIDKITHDGDLMSIEFTLNIPEINKSEKKRLVVKKEEDGFKYVSYETLEKKTVRFSIVSAEGDKLNASIDLPVSWRNLTGEDKTSQRFFRSFYSDHYASLSTVYKITGEREKYLENFFKATDLVAKTRREFKQMGDFKNGRYYNFFEYDEYGRFQDEFNYHIAAEDYTVAFSFIPDPKFDLEQQKELFEECLKTFKLTDKEFENKTKETVVFLHYGGGHGTGIYFDTPESWEDDPNGDFLYGDNFTAEFKFINPKYTGQLLSHYSEIFTQFDDDNKTAVSQNTWQTDNKAFKCYVYKDKLIYYVYSNREIFTMTVTPENASQLSAIQKTLKPILNTVKVA